MPRKRNASLSDVAARAGVDRSIASRVLSGAQDVRVRADTRQRINDAARELGYRPHALARGLRTSKSFTIGMVVPQLDNPVFPQMIEGAEIAARERGYTLIVSHIGEGRLVSRTLRELNWSRHVDGLMIAALDMDQGAIHELDAIDAPYVVVNQAGPHIRNYAVLDSFAAAELAVRHLIDLGHRRIAHVAGRRGGYNSEHRRRGYRQALETASIAYDPDLVAWGGFSQQGGYDATRSLLETLSPAPSAIFTATILSAAGAMAAARAVRLSLPDDLSIAAIHDGALAEALYPSLTTVRMPLERMGRDAANALIDNIEGRRKDTRIVLPPQKLVIRRSTATFECVS